MKKFILLFFIASLFFGCKKDKDKPNGQVVIYTNQQHLSYIAGGSIYNHDLNFSEDLKFSKTPPDCNAEGFAVLTMPAGTYTLRYYRAGGSTKEGPFQVTVESGKCTSYNFQ